jgi:hypothetical protein
MRVRAATTRDMVLLSLCTPAACAGDRPSEAPALLSEQAAWYHAGLPNTAHSCISRAVHTHPHVCTSLQVFLHGFCTREQTGKPISGALPALRCAREYLHAEFGKRPGIATPHRSFAALPLQA